MRGRKRVVRRRTEGPSIITKRRADRSEQVAWWIGAGLVVLAVLPYVQTLSYEFVNLDDGDYVVANPLVQQGLTWSNVGWAFTTTTAANWHPLTWLSHMVDCQIFGVRLGWHHLVNALFHGANTVLLFVVLRAMTGMAWRSALVAALFAVHPLHVESVAWIAERKDVLSTFFGLWAIWAYMRYTRDPSLPRYGLVVGLFGLSLLSKPMLVTLPFVLLLLDVWPLQRFWVENGAPKQDPKLVSLFLEKLPLLVMSAASSVVTLKAQHAAMLSIELVPLPQRLANAIVAYASYLGKAFWPVDLAVIYPLHKQTPVAKMVPAILLIAGITIGMGMLIRKRPWLTVGWLWFLGTLVPVIGLVQVGSQAMADRYTYVPLIGLFIMIAWSLPAAAFAASKSGPRAITIAALILMLTALEAVTFAQIKVWKNSTTLFDHAVKVTEGNFMAYNALGGANVLQGQMDEAISNYRHALELYPNYPEAYRNLASAFVRQGKYAEAVEMSEKALQLLPQVAETHAILGVALWNVGRADESIWHSQKAVELNPALVSARLNLGLSLFEEGNYDEAIVHLEYALRLSPQHQVAQKYLSAARKKRDEIGVRP